MKENEDSNKHGKKDQTEVQPCGGGPSRGFLLLIFFKRTLVRSKSLLEVSALLLSVIEWTACWQVVHSVSQ